jgi:hypothetical protein
VFDKQERRNLAQVITDIIYQRPRIDIYADYFVGTYQLEIACLYRRVQILKILADRMVNSLCFYFFNLIILIGLNNWCILLFYFVKTQKLNDMRELSTRLNGTSAFGLPYKIVKKKLITPHLDQ